MRAFACAGPACTLIHHHYSLPYGLAVLVQGRGLGPPVVAELHEVLGRDGKRGERGRVESAGARVCLFFGTATRARLPSF